MIKVGDLVTEGAGGIVYQDGDSFVFHFGGMAFDENDQEGHFTEISKKFPSLAALREHYSGFAFRPTGTSDFDLSEISKLLSGSTERLRKLRAIYEERGQA